MKAAAAPVVQRWLLVPTIAVVGGLLAVVLVLATAPWYGYAWPGAEMRSLGIQAVFTGMVSFAVFGGVAAVVTAMMPGRRG